MYSLAENSVFSLWATPKQPLPSAEKSWSDPVNRIKNRVVFKKLILFLSLLLIYTTNSDNQYTKTATI